MGDTISVTKRDLSRTSTEAVSRIVKNTGKIRRRGAVLGETFRKPVKQPSSLLKE